ncbi:hypothetical protein SAMN05216257_101630 [Meinhardsimonia xiamenensis]|jgi:predicted deacylase|uniref:Succinylglutamate desuccinylase/Aspartoacylase catalytic domain-containing protein n=1 Tax=Meinhardsimonia xiamenensis TaxID=990712 RepID=A0A1G8Z944_9RHOB|nr:succinylglutamate desuccinylase/aspartoacylase family protein [Meinhardsimonia xiamenensis]PRX37605.1 hypothetical protein LV81_01385 [Meinhardsimonia xiamenensis]SDK11592.1 hypothetical protein SAMN05216257_101630 [Meinhardsimonia xiamenensis]
MARRDAFEINGTSVAPGTRRTVEIPVGVLSDHTPVTMSVHVVHGRKPGPVIFVSAAIHGDEVIGVEIVRRLLNTRALRSLSGTLLVVPIVNTFGFHNRSRYLPDRRDLNRSFPGSPRGSMAARLAHRFMNEVVLRSSFGIDLHSAAIHRTNMPQLRITPDNDRLEELARAFAAPVLLHSNVREGSLRAAAAEAGVGILLYEAGEGLRFDEDSARFGVAGILRVMQALEMLPARLVPKAKAPSVVCRRSVWHRAPMGGLFRARQAHGGVVKEGEILGVIADPLGETEATIRAAGDGIVIGRTTMPVVYEGEALVHVALTARPEEAEARLDALYDTSEEERLFDEDEII